MLRRIRRTLTAGATIAGFSAIIACGERASETTSRRSSPIVFGEASPSPSEDDAVLLLRTDVSGRELICSAALVAPNLAVTARHCVSYATEGPFTCTLQGELVDNPEAAGTLGEHLPAPSLEFYGGEYPGPTPVAVGSKVLSTLSSTVCSDDLAFVVLDRALVLPTAKLRMESRTHHGDLLTMVGYGLDETGDPDWRTRPRRRTMHHPIAAIGPDSVRDGVTTVKPRTLLVVGPSVCAGDSGGPAFAETTGALVGIDSLAVGEGCTRSTIDHLETHVPPFRSLVMDAFAAAGAAPNFEKPLLGLGEPCAAAFECAGDWCTGSDDGSNRCTQSCSDAKPCPAAYACQSLELDGQAIRLCVKDSAQACAEGSCSADGSCVPCDAGASAPPAVSSEGCAMSHPSRSAATRGCGLVVLAVAAFRRRRRSVPPVEEIDGRT